MYILGINLVDVENAQQSKKPSSTTTARPITSSLSTTKAVDQTGYYSGGEDTEVDDDGKISTKPNTLWPLSGETTLVFVVSSMYISIKKTNLSLSANFLFGIENSNDVVVWFFSLFYSLF